MSFYIIVLLLIISAFIPLAFLSGRLIEMTIRNQINNKLKKYGYELVAVKNTKNSFRTTKKEKPSWKNFFIMDYSTAQVTRYKEIEFKTANADSLTSLVLIESFLLFFHSIHFEIDLKTSKK